MTAAGFPHSGTPGSTPTCGSPRLFAACRALLRLSVPRHPPCALRSLDRICSLRLLKDEDQTGPTDSQNHTRLVLSRLSRRIPTQHPIPTTHVVKQPVRGISKSPRSQIIYTSATSLSTGRRGPVSLYQSKTYPAASRRAAEGHGEPLRLSVPLRGSA